jgi:hypothetical protein
MKPQTVLLIIIVFLCAVIGALVCVIFTKVEQHNSSFRDRFISEPNHLDLEHNTAFYPIGPKIPKGLKTLTYTYYTNISPDTWQNPEKVLLKSSQEDVFHYDRDGHLLKREVNREKKQPWGWWLFRYDDKGNRISEERDSESVCTIYQYDTRNNRIGWTYFNVDGSLKSRATLKYDDQGQLIEETRQNASGLGKEMYLYSYNCKGQLIQREDHEPPGIPRKRNIYLYDHQGNKIEWIEYLTGRKEHDIRERESYRYDGKNNLIEQIKYSSNGVAIDRETYQYDEKGNKTEECRYIVSKETYIICYKSTYQYNEQGHMIEMNYYSQGEFLGGRATFQYEFYPPSEENK